MLMGLCKAPKGTKTKVASNKGHFCAHAKYLADSLADARIV